MDQDPNGGLAQQLVAEWSFVCHAPIVLVGLIVLTVGATWFLTRVFYTRQIETLKQQVDFHKDRADNIQTAAPSSIAGPQPAEPDSIGIVAGELTRRRDHALVLIGSSRIPVEPLFFRLQVAAAGSRTVRDCRALLVSIERDGQELLNSRIALSFADNATNRIFVTTLHHGAPERIDIMHLLDNANGNANVTISGEGAPIGFQSDQVFRNLGHYHLKLVVTGEDVPSLTVNLLFEQRGPTSAAQMSIES